MFSLLAATGSSRSFCQQTNLISHSLLVETNDMRFIFSIALLLIVTVHSVADDADAKLSDGDPVEQQLLQRIANLEQRIARLEASLNQPQYAPPSLTNPAPLPSRPIPPQTQRTFPPYAQQVVPQTTQPRSPVPTYAPVPRPQAPESWQRFEFNGQSFYIVPIDQADPRISGRR